MATMFHVSSVHNRRSIERHGLDVARMGAACGIAGSTRPEAEGIFLAADDWETDYFVRMNNTGGRVDVWQVEAVDVDRMLDNGSGYFYLPGRIAVEQVRLVRQDLLEPDLRS